MVVKVISGDHAVAWAARLARVEVVPAFPITPQTLIVEQIAEFVNNGEMDADFIPVESEHSVMSVAVGASAGGVRTFTATASQGLALMHEMLYSAPQIRLPVVMANVNRSLGAAAGIWLEHNDSMPERESGWLQCYVEDNQEALDMTLQAFRIAEDHRVMLPMMICLDGFVLSHTVERVDIPEQAAVDSFLPKFEPMNVLDPDDPIVMNPICPPEYATEMRYQLDRAIDSAKEVIKEVGIDFAQTFRSSARRPPGPVPHGRCGIRFAGAGHGRHHIQVGCGRAAKRRQEGRPDPAAFHAAVPQGGAAYGGIGAQGPGRL